MVKRISCLCGLGMVVFSSFGQAADWQNSWSVEKQQSAKYCAQLFDNYQLQAVCMDNERNGYKAMQGNFGFSVTEAHKAKSRCAQIFEAFQLQAVCMQNEKNGFDAMQNY